MPRRRNPTNRHLAAIFELARQIGTENVLLNDEELGGLLAGSDEEGYAAGSVANARYQGKLNIPRVRCLGAPRTRLSDALAWIQAGGREPVQKFTATAQPTTVTARQRGSGARTRGGSRLF
jgi:hypothetical protein